jgi:hypothetical protein
VVTALVSLARPALAQEAKVDEAQQERMNKEAKRLCLSGKAEEGVAILIDLYVETGDKAHIFNQARCYQQCGLWEKAVLRFQEYLRKEEEVSETQKQATLRHIEELNKRIDEERARKTAPKATKPDPVAPPPGPGARDADVSTSVAPGDRFWVDWSWQKKLGASGLAAGGLSLLAGVVFHIVREGRVGDFADAGCGENNLDVPLGADCRGKHDAVGSAGTMAVVGYAGAALLGGAGTYFFLTAPDGPTRASSRPSLVCAPGVGDLGMSCRAIF